MRWTDTPIHCLDFEGNRTSGILEYGLATVRGGEVVACRTRLCAPTGTVRREDAALHRLTLERVAGAAPFALEWDLFAALRAQGPFAAHFAGTENALLKAVWPYGRAAPDFARPGGSTLEWGPWVDTGRLVPQVFGGLRSNRLEDVVTALGLEEELARLATRHCPPGRVHYHAALFDALAVAVLLGAVCRQPKWAEATLPWLMAHSRGDAEDRAELQQGRLF
jgi:DNA polymerase III epsilon subunit-like protein